MLSLLVESWTWYAIAMLILLARYVSRWLQLRSFKHFQADDYLMAVVFCFYTTLVVVMNIVAHLDTNLMMPDDIPKLTPESIRSRIHGSKLVLVVEQSMIMTTWGCKICLLLMYNKLTFGLKQQLAVKIIAAYVLGGLVLMEILYFGVWCRPFHGYWQVPVQNVQCSAAIHHLITNSVLNISSDLMMLCIPLPLLINSKLPRAKKLILCCLFGLGLFVILCAVLNKYYSFAHPFSPMWTFWYIREASTAVMVANMPMCWALLRRVFHLRAFNNASSPNSTLPSGTAPRTIGSQRLHIYDVKSSSLSSIKDGSKRSSGGEEWWERDAAAINDSSLERTESEEYIVSPPKSMPLEIWESKEFDIDIDVRAEGTGPHDEENQVIQDVMFDGGTKTTTIVSAPRPPPRRSASRGRARSGSRGLR